MILFGLGKREDKGVVAARDDLPRVRSVSVSEAGLVRAVNEDRLFVDEDRFVYCVADGVGGGEEGAYGSGIVCANLKMVVYAAEPTFKARLSAVQKAIEESNATLYEYARLRGSRPTASTVAVLVLDPENLRHAAVCNVGDSRIYRIRRGMPDLLTRDHRKGSGDNTLTRAIGACAKVETEWLEIESTDPSSFCLCTDGVHDLLSAGRLAAHISAAPDLATAAKRISGDIVRHGASDNYSFVLLSV